MSLDEDVRRAFEAVAITAGLATAFYGAYDAQNAPYVGTIVSLSGTFVAVGGAVSRSWRIQDATDPDKYATEHRSPYDAHNG